MTTITKTKNDVFSQLEVKVFNLNEFIGIYDLIQEADDFEYYGLDKLVDFKGLLIKDLFIWEHMQGKGHGKRFVDDMKVVGMPLIVYSTFDSVDFWQKMGFEQYCGSDYVFVWLP
jgi:GNAT superfamily N-acetyltransferase